MFRINIHRQDYVKLLAIPGTIMLAALAALAPFTQGVQGAHLNPALLQAMAMGPDPAGVSLNSPDNRPLAGIGAGDAAVTLIYGTGHSAIPTLFLATGAAAPQVPGVDAGPSLVDSSDSGTGSFSAVVKQPVVFDCSTVSEIPPVECEALVALYNSTDGANWFTSTGWFGSNTPCRWFGLTCREGKVSEISFFNNELTGSIPPELGNLDGLQKVYLTGNQLTGSIPPELANLTSLQVLFLSSNQLTGNIPLELGNLGSLQTMDLSSNQLTGSIPPELGKLAGLQVLDLHGNQLTGSIPPELDQLTSLLDLNLSFNQLTGTIPPQLGDLASLQSLDLGPNQLTGSIPPELDGLASLERLNLVANQLTGNIPPELAILANLQSLYLYENQLTGSIPPELANLSRLEVLNLTSNQLTGSIPPELGNMVSLWGLALGGNLLNGNIPMTLISLDLTVFYFNDTALCEPPDQAFQDWLAGIGDVQSTGVVCESDSAAAAEPSFTLYQDQSDGATGVKLGIARVLDPATDSDVPVPLDLVQARLSYDPVCLNLREIREMDLPLADINIGHPAGLASFTGTIPATGSAPFDLGHALTRLVGSNQQSCPLTMEITSLTDQEGNPISVTGSLTHEFRRGDARADGVINVADALYIAQYLNGLRPACTDVVDTGCLHSVNATSVSQDGPFDRKAIADANFIAQHLLGLRDESYDLLPLPDFDVAEAS